MTRLWLTDDQKQACDPAFVINLHFSSTQSCRIPAVESELCVTVRMRWKVKTGLTGSEWVAPDDTE